jgi:corrinoid protein of di/trimethylamine methyltransferase
MSILQEISEALQKGKAKVVSELVQKALDDGLKPGDILNQGLLSGMEIIGEKFKNNEIYVPEVLIAARAMNNGATILKPHLAESGVKPIGKVALGTVKGDLHDIGKNLVRMMLEGKGIEVVDLGVDVPAEKFYETYEKEGVQIIACSALLTTTMNEMKNVVDYFTEKGARDNVTFMVGGAPITESFCKSIGADYYTADAASAADVAKKVLVGA